MKSLVFGLIVSLLFSCQRSPKQEVRKFVEEPLTPEKQLPNQLPLLPSDTIIISSGTSDSYKYKERSGSSGHYTYTYDVSGYNDQGEYFYGSVDVENKYGSGYLYSENGDEIYIDVEWVEWGVLSGYDDEGTSYELEVD